MGKYFGTDGVRGVANRELTPELALRIGRAAAWSSEQSTKPIVVERDTPFRSNAGKRGGGRRSLHRA